MTGHLVRAAACGVVAASSFAALPAHAEPPRASIAFALPPARLIGPSIPGGVRGASSVPSGFLLGVDTGWATLLPSGSDDAHGAWAFGVRVGWAFRNGLSVFARYDDLGVTTGGSRALLQLATLGVRYEIPWVVLPFGEALVGPSVRGTDVAPAGGIGAGVALPIGRHFGFELAVRDWITPVDGTVRSTLAAQAGIRVTFGGRR